MYLSRNEGKSVVTERFIWTFNEMKWNIFLVKLTNTTWCEILLKK